MPITVGVLGASGALGKEIIAALEKAPYAPEELVPLARAATKSPFAHYKDADIAIDAVEDTQLDRLDLLFLVTPRAEALTWGTEALKEGVPVVDASGGIRSSAVPMGVPWVNPEVVASAGLQALSMPSPEAILAGSVLAPLQRAGLGGDAEATFFVPASRFGRDALSELSAQVISLFNSGTPPRKIFPDGLAFDLLPSSGEPGTGWTSSEKEIAEEVHALVGLDFVATRVTVPVFSGMAMELRIEPRRRPDTAMVLEILSEAGLAVSGEHPRDLPRPRRVEGMPFAQVGRIRIDEEGEVLRIWAAFDNLRGCATVAVGLGALLLR